jgi:ATP-binding cassette subfamily B multidrug efflux pump
VNRSFIKVRNAVAGLNAFVQEHIPVCRWYRHLQQKKESRKNSGRSIKQHRNANIKAIFAYSVFFPVVELVSALSIGLLVWWAAKESLHLARKSRNMWLVSSLHLYYVLTCCFSPLRVMADKFNVLQMGMIASERVFKVLDNE